VLIAHLSDLHLKDAADVTWLERQLDRIARRRPEHLAVTGDLLDRWDPDLLELALDAFATRGFMDAERLTIFHGNHDLASSGGHPRRTSDVWRLAFRFWDPPPLIAARRRRFYAALEARAPKVGAVSPALKVLRSGLRVAIVDTVPAPWKPISIVSGRVVVHHAIGSVRPSEMEWLAQQRAPSPLILLTHHYPLDAPQFTWTPLRPDFSSRFARLMSRIVREVVVPMAIVDKDRDRFWAAAAAASAKLVLCGHVHRARFDWHDGIAVGLNGQSGADWAGRTIAYYEINSATVRMELERVD
jgi:3',5'-cyclic AMP phosphodiesterase CpdA